MNRLTRSGDTVRSSKNQQTLQESLQPAPIRGEVQQASFFLPARYEENYKYPLIVWLHEDGGSQRSLAEVMPHISTQNFVGVGVQATRACDNAGHRYQWLQSPIGTAVAEDSVFSAIELAAKRFSIHPDRVYLAGYREGGTMAMRIGLRSPSHFGGVITIDGALPRGGKPLVNLEDARQLEILSAVAIEGERYPMQQVCEDLKLWHAARLRMDMRQYTVSDCLVTEVLRDVNAWIMGKITGTHKSGCLPELETVPVEFSLN